MSITWLILALHVVLAAASIIHALLNKKDPRAALGWIAVCFAYPLVGPLSYYLFGINRIKTHAHKLSGKSSFSFFNNERPDYEKTDSENLAKTSRVTLSMLPAMLAKNATLSNLALASTAVTHRSLLDSNTLKAFFSADHAYDNMVETIKQAQASICLSSYIFASDRTGRKFIQALSDANQRGVEVRVLIDGIGEYYSFPTVGRLLKKTGVSVARFTPPRLFPPAIHINLRNHRKLLIVDRVSGFTGGMNISDRHLSRQPNGQQGISDVHFYLNGPIITQLLEVFEEDWAFATGKPVRSIANTSPVFADRKSPPISASPTPPPMLSIGNSVCRVVTDGPNEDLGKLAMILTGATALASRRIAIMTPYFLPPAILINSLQAAALRGVDVSIILPAQSNQPMVHWATRNMLWELLQYGVHIYYQPAPFAHSKFMLIDDHYAHIGSANMDPRSLRLNFELIVEIFDKDFVMTMDKHFTQIQQASIEETLKNIDQRSLPIRIRDAAAWIFSPYL